MLGEWFHQAFSFTISALVPYLHAASICSILNQSFDSFPVLLYPCGVMEPGPWRFGGFFSIKQVLFGSEVHSGHKLGHDYFWRVGPGLITLHALNCWVDCQTGAKSLLMLIFKKNKNKSLSMFEFHCLVQLVR